jgi:RNA polymerase sigma-70 factor (ECF subfamily)
MPAGLDGALIDRLYRRANAARWQLPVSRFAEALERSVGKAFGERAPAATELERYLGSLRLDEIALACACTEGHEGAWDHFVLEYRPILYRAADAMAPGGGARDLADSLYADLYGLRERSGVRQSLFRYFHGRSSLATWLRAVLAQHLVDRARVHRREAPLPDTDPATPPQPPDPDRSRLLDLVHQAFAAAVSALDPRDRLRIRYYYVHGLTLAETGRLVGEHEASVSRHLSSTRKAIRRDVERRLRDVPLEPAEIDRCFECVVEESGALDLERLLGGSGDASVRAPAVQRSDAGEPVAKGPAVEGVHSPRREGSVG